MNKKDLIQQAIGFQEELNRLITEYRTENWLSVDLTIAQLKSLVYIYSKGRANLRGLAKALDVTPSVVTGIVDRLIMHGVVKRKREGDSTDRRIQWLRITKKGQALLDNLRQQTTRNMSEVLETMSDKDLSALVRGFSALIGATEQYLREQHKAIDTANDWEE